jgi:pimeloyl-ACP methyl ester carboxylesterase
MGAATSGIINKWMVYQPPASIDLGPGITDVPYTVQTLPSAPNLTYSLNMKWAGVAGDSESLLPLVRIFYLHGNAEDISSTYYDVNDLLDIIVRGLGANVLCMAVDYPCYGKSPKRDDLLGTPELDKEIEILYDFLTTLNTSEPPNRCINVVWSSSIGTRYSCQLCARRSETINLLFLQAPFYTLATSCTYVGASFIVGTFGDGLNQLRGIDNRPPTCHVVAQYAANDEIFPPSVVIRESDGLVDNYDIVAAIGHQGFSPESATGVKRYASYFRDQIIQALTQGSELRESSSGLYSSSSLSERGSSSAAVATSADDLWLRTAEEAFGDTAVPLTPDELEEDEIVSSSLS